jgi:hypothetical protein
LFEWATSDPVRRKTEPTRWNKWRSQRLRYWVRRGMDRHLAERWAMAEQSMRMRLALFVTDDIAERMELVVRPTGELDFDFDTLI